MASVAREAGVGIATLLRHFPTKEDLVGAVFADRMDAYADAVADRPSTTPTRGTASSATSSPSARCRPPTTASRRADHDVPHRQGAGGAALEAYHGFVELIARAKATGRLRDDFAPEDLVCS